MTSRNILMLKDEKGYFSITKKLKKKCVQFDFFKLKALYY